jgi:trehalose 6-phosphate synthase
MLYATDPADSRHRALAGLADATGVLINPTYDGFNLVAKEAALVSADSAILLSRSAGAYEHLAPLVTPLDPCDVIGTADALEAVTAPTRPPDAAAADRVRRGIAGDTAAGWLAAALGDPAAGDAALGEGARGAG